MTSFGRGRGWSLQKREQELRRPGGLLCTSDVVNDILNRLSSHGVCEMVSPQLVQEIIDLMTNPSNKDSLRYFTVVSLATIILLLFSTILYMLGKRVTSFGNNPYSMTLLQQD